MWKREYEEKIFSPNNYYTGDVADKIDYTMDDLADSVGAGTTVQSDYECSDQLTALSVDTKSPGDPGLSWFFEDGAGMDQLTEADAWDSSSFTFVFDREKPVAVPAKSKTTQYFPMEERYNLIANQPSQMYNSSNNSSGYTITMESTEGYYKQAMSNSPFVDGNEGFIFRFEYEHLSQFWCCLRKPGPDVRLSTDSPYTLYKPSDAFMLDKEIPAGYAVGAAGWTGNMDREDTTKNYVTISLSYKHGSSSVTGESAVFKPCTFRDFWNYGPAILKGDTTFGGLFGGSADNTTADTSLTANIGSVGDLKVYNEAEGLYSFTVDYTGIQTSSNLYANGAYFSLGDGKYVLLNVSPRTTLTVIGPFYENEHNIVGSQKKDENGATMTSLRTGTPKLEYKSKQGNQSYFTYGGKKIYFVQFGGTGTTFVGTHGTTPYGESIPEPE